MRRFLLLGVVVVLAVATGYAIYTVGRPTAPGGPAATSAPVAITTAAGPGPTSGSGAVPSDAVGGPGTTANPSADGPPTVYSYSVVAEFPHDPSAFTQGLVYLDDTLYEGTGLYGESTLRRVDLATGEVLQSIDLPAQVFGEGIAVVGQRILQLTWRAGVAYAYDRATFEKQDDYAYSTEGWGLTPDGDRLVMSDGTPNLYFRDPETFEELGHVTVTADGSPVRNLNELEMVRGELFANVWQTDKIAIVDLETGDVQAWLDLSGLLPAEERIAGTDVLNGIAYDAAGDRLFVTGKKWPKLYEIKLVPERPAHFTSTLPLLLDTSLGQLLAEAAAS